MHKIILGLFMTSLLAACGSGGGNTASTSTPPPPAISKPAPILYQDATTVSVVEGNPLRLEVFLSAFSEGPHTFQWQRNGVAVPGATDSSYTIEQAQLTDHGSVYQLVARNAGGSTSASINVAVTPSIGTIRVVAGQFPENRSTQAQLLQSTMDGAGFDGQGGMVFSDRYKLLHLSKTGQWTTLLRRDESKHCSSPMATDRAGNVYLSINCDGIIWKITPDGKRLYFADTSKIKGQYENDYWFTSMAVADDGSIYAVDHTWAVKKISPQGQVTVYAGNPAESGAVDGTLSAARFGALSCITLDKQGNVYVCENGKVRKITPGGAVSTLPMLDISDLQVDSTGTLFGVRFRSIVTIAADGSSKVFAGSEADAPPRDGIGTDAVFSWPVRLAFDGKGDMHAFEPGYGVRKITPSGQVTTVVRLPAYVAASAPVDGVAGDARFTQIGPMAVDSQGLLFAVDVAKGVTMGQLRRIDAAGRVQTISGPVVGLGDKIAVDKDGNIYMSDGTNVSKRSPGGASSILYSTAGRSYDGRGIHLSGMALNASGILHVFESTSCTNINTGIGTPRPPLCYPGKLLRLSPTGSPTLLAGDFRSGILYPPLAMAMAEDGTTYLAEWGRTDIRTVSPDGQVQTYWNWLANDSGAATAPGVPEALALDQSGNLYIQDLTAIRKRTPAGAITIVPRFTAMSLTNPDHIPFSVSQNLSNMTVAPDGSIYCSYANMIVKITLR